MLFLTTSPQTQNAPHKMSEPSPVEELVDFLADPWPEARHIAVQNVAGLTATDGGITVLKGTEVVQDLTKLIGDINPIYKLAVNSLINICASQEVFNKTIDVDNIFEKLMNHILVHGVES